MTMKCFNCDKEIKVFRGPKIGRGGIPFCSRCNDEFNDFVEKVERELAGKGVLSS